MSEREPFPLPPPRRTASATPSAAGQRTPTNTATTGLWEKTKTSSTSAWNGLYKVADKAGAWSNSMVGKLGVEAFYPTSLDLECSKAARILRMFTVDAADLPEESLADNGKKQKVIKKIPQSAIENCKGIAIFTVFRTGLVVSGASGSGVVLARLADGSWSPPSGILLHTIGFGFSGGADVYDVVLILRTEAAVKSFTKPRVTLGAEVSVAAGPVGSGFMLEMGIEASPVWSYVKSKGIYGGLQMDGNIVIERNDENARAYHRPGIKALEVLRGETMSPYWCADLHQTILAAEGKAHRPLQSNESPGSYSGVHTPARRLPPQAEDELDLIARREMEQAMAELGEDPSINQRARDADELAQTTSTFDEINIRDSGDAKVEDGNEVGVERVVEKKTGPPPTLPARRVVPAVPVAAVEVEKDDELHDTKGVVEVEAAKDEVEDDVGPKESDAVEEKDKGTEAASVETK